MISTQSSRIYNPGADPCVCNGDCPPPPGGTTCEGDLCICGGYFSEEGTAMNSKGIMRISANNACPKCNCIIKTKFFKDRCQAYNYITSMSHDANGTFIREVAALILKDGVLIVPFNNNTSTTANMDAFQYNITATGVEVIINGVNHEILQIVHTHPGEVTTGDNPLGFSPKNDGKWSNLLQHDMQIIMDGSVYLVGMNNYLSYYNLNQIKSPCEQ